MLPDLLNKQFGPVRWLGRFGNAYEFQLDPLGSVYRDVPGVYIFCKCVGKNNWQALYVGETSNMQRRLTDELYSHHSLAAVLIKGATHVSTLRVEGGLSARLTVETDLRHALNPCCNKQ